MSYEMESIEMALNRIASALEKANALKEIELQEILPCDNILKPKTRMEE